MNEKEVKKIRSIFNKLEKCKCLTKNEKDIIIDFIRDEARSEFTEKCKKKKHLLLGELAELDFNEYEYGIDRWIDNLLVETSSTEQREGK